MNFVQIHYFLTVAKTLSFTRAAKLLYITQPAISRHINSMEEELGFKLFTRINRSLQLTPEGFVLATELDKVYFGYDTAVMKAREATHPQIGHLLVGITDGMDLDDLLSTTLRKMAADLPDIDIALFNFGYEEIVTRLMEGKLDVAFSRAFDVDSRGYLESRKIAHSSDTLAVSLNNPLCKKKSVSFRDLQDQTIILASETEDDINRKMIVVECAKHGFTPKLKYSPSYHANFIWVKSGLGVTIVDDFSMIPTAGIALLPFYQYKDTSLVMTWSDKNANPARPLFEEAFFSSNPIE